MNKYSPLLFLFLSSFYYAQKISGSVTDHQTKRISYAEVILSHDQKKTSAVTDNDGKFSLSLPSYGTYDLAVYVNGEKEYTEKINLVEDREITIQLPEKSNTGEKNIAAVAIIAKKKLVEQKVDRLVFNVENSVASQGLDAIEALEKSPMIRISNDVISIAGKSSVSVMVNDRLLNLSGQDLINYLKTIRSDDIAKIEVITTPPSKYDASGKSGMINIVLKKNTSLGWNGTLQSSGTYRKNVSYRDGATMNYQGKELSLTANASIGESIWENENATVITAENYLWNSKSNSLGKYRYKSGVLKGEYKINDHNSIGWNYNISRSDPRNTNNTTTYSLMNGEENRFDSENAGSSRNTSHNSSVFYEIKLDTLSSKLSFTANLMKNISDTYNAISTFNGPGVFGKTLGNSNYQIANGQIDLEKNTKKLKTEGGLKYTNIRNNSTFKYFNQINGEEALNTLRSNDFQYEEQNFAAYASSSFKISEKLDAKVGLRYEYTLTKGFSPQLNETNKNQYGEFFPTGYLTYKPNDNNSVSLNYTRRIDRPYFWSLNPFKSYISEYEYYSGNPSLRPSITDNIEISYVLKNNFTVGLYGSFSKNEVDQLQVIDGETKYSTNQNLYNEKRAGINLNYNFTKFSWLESYLSGTAFYAKSISNFENVIPLKGYGANFSINNNFFLNKNKTVVYILGYWFDAASKIGNTASGNMGGLYSGIKLSLMEKNLNVNLFVNDILNTVKWSGTEYYQGFTSSYSGSGSNQNLNLSVTYRFGNKNVKGATKQIKFDDQNRGGGSQGGGK